MQAKLLCGYVSDGTASIPSTLRKNPLESRRVESSRVAMPTSQSSIHRIKTSMVVQLGMTAAFECRMSRSGSGSRSRSSSRSKSGSRMGMVNNSCAVVVLRRWVLLLRRRLPSRIRRSSAQSPLSPSSPPPDYTTLHRTTPHYTTPHHTA